MTTTKRACELRKGDIIDVRPLDAFGFGYVYHELRCDARQVSAHPDTVSFDLDVVDPSTRNRDHFGWPLHINRNTLVAVCLDRPLQQRYEMEDEE